MAVLDLNFTPKSQGSLLPLIYHHFDPPAVHRHEMESGYRGSWFLSLPRVLQIYLTRTYDESKQVDVQ